MITNCIEQHTLHDIWLSKYHEYYFKYKYFIIDFEKYNEKIMIFNMILYIQRSFYI